MFSSMPLDASGKVVPLVSFEAEVVVLGAERYPLKDSDPLSEFSPLDIAVGWGVVGKRQLREKVRWAQLLAKF